MTYHSLRLRWTIQALALIASIVWPTLGTAAGPSGAYPPGDDPATTLNAPPLASLASQLAEQATLESRRADVEWSPAGATRWQQVAQRQTVSAGDRLRTNLTGAGRLVYFEGSSTELEPNTSLVVQRLERSPGGNVLTNLLQSAGTTVSRMGQMFDTQAGFEVSTPAATAFVRGTFLWVHHDDANDRTTVANVIEPNNPTARVFVRGTDPQRTEVTLQSGQGTQIGRGLAPLPPLPLNQLPLGPNVPTPRAPSGGGPGGLSGGIGGPFGGDGTGPAGGGGPASVLLTQPTATTNTSTQNCVGGSSAGSLANVASGSGTAGCTVVTPPRLLPLPRGSVLVPPRLPALAPPHVPPVVGAGALALVPPHPTDPAKRALAGLDVDLGPDLQGSFLVEPDPHRWLAVRLVPLPAESGPSGEASGAKLALDVFDGRTGASLAVPVTLGLRRSGDGAPVAPLVTSAASGDVRPVSAWYDATARVLRLEVGT